MPLSIFRERVVLDDVAVDHRTPVEGSEAESFTLIRRLVGDTRCGLDF